jgi:hypothetical protein
LAITGAGEHREKTLHLLVRRPTISRSGNSAYHFTCQADKLAAHALGNGPAIRAEEVISIAADYAFGYEVATASEDVRDCGGKVIQKIVRHSAPRLQALYPV